MRPAPATDPAGGASSGGTSDDDLDDDDAAAATMKAIEALAAASMAPQRGDGSGDRRGAGGDGSGPGGGNASNNMANLGEMLGIPSFFGLGNKQTEEEARLLEGAPPELPPPPSMARASTPALPRAGGAVPGLGLGMKLDLAKLAPAVVEGDRPDDDGRQPPTPTYLVVERLKAQQAAKEAEAAAGGGSGTDRGGSGANGGGSGANGGGAASDRGSVTPCLSKSASTSGAAARPDLNLSRALQEMSISELSVALAHHSSNRSLLANASWAVDASEIKFGRRIGAGAYGEVYEAEWRRSRVAVKRLLTISPLEEKAVREFFAEMDILSNARHDHIVRFLGGCVQPDNL